MHISGVTSSTNQQALQLAAERLSSGKRIVSAAADPAGLAIASELTAQANGFDAGARNAQSAIDASNVAQGVSATLSAASQQLQTLSVAANNDLLSAGDRANLQTQANAITQSAPVSNGSAASATIQTGAAEGNTTTLDFPPSDPRAVGLSNVDLSSSASATTAEDSAGAALATIGNDQATLGSQTVVLQIDRQNSASASNGLTSSASTIADSDITKTSADAARAQATSHVQIALELQANLAASSLLGFFPKGK